jgi:adenosylcobinamide kinase/adenosylcobinamide-phosphate guanylyltransferase
MGKITFIIGGARSGKSHFAMKMAKDAKHKKVAFVATGEARDEEMKRRIALHKKARPASWRTFEEPCHVSRLIKTIGGKFELVIIDCLTLLVSNLLLIDRKENYIEREISNIVSELRKAKSDCIIVSNEVGLGIVPENSLARDFRDIAGRVNQIVARRSDEAFFTVAGIPWRIK